MSRLLETIKIENGIARNLKWHEERCAHSRRLLFRQKMPSLPLREALSENLLQLPNGIFKCRILYLEHIESIDFQRYTPRTIYSLQCVEASDLEYNLKWEERGGINRCFAQRGSADDVLLVKNGLLTDASTANVALWDGQQWYTPAQPLLAGTCRARLLAQGIIQTAEIRISDVQKFLKIRLFNAMMGWSGGVEVAVESVYLPT